MERFICIKSLKLNCYDDNGFVIENKYTEIVEGEIFQRSEEPFRCIGSNDSVRLENNNHWIEICKETFNRHFEKLI